MADHRNDPFAPAESTAAVEGSAGSSKAGWAASVVRDRVAITGQATPRAVAGPLGECLLDTLAAQQCCERAVSRVGACNSLG